MIREPDKTRSVIPFAPHTAGEVRVLRERIELEFRVKIGKPMRALRAAETATLHALFEQAGVGLETVALHELPVNRADRRAIINGAKSGPVRNRRRFESYKKRHPNA